MTGLGCGGGAWSRRRLGAYVQEISLRISPARLGMIRSLALLSVLALAGCATPVSSEPPDSQITVAEAYAESLDGADLAVVVGTVVVTDGGVATHLGGTETGQGATYRAFFAQTLPSAAETSTLGTVRVYDAAELDSETPLDPATLAVDGFDPRLVLVLETLYIDRATYYTQHMGAPGVNGVPTTTTTSTQALRIDTAILLWDRQLGAEVASGQLDTERTLPPLGRSRQNYADAVGEFVEQLARFTPIRLRE